MITVFYIYIMENESQFYISSIAVFLESIGLDYLSSSLHHKNTGAHKIPLWSAHSSYSVKPAEQTQSIQ